MEYIYLSDQFIKINFNEWTGGMMTVLKSTLLKAGIVGGLLYTGCLVQRNTFPTVDQVADHIYDLRYAEANKSERESLESVGSIKAGLINNDVSFVLKRRFMWARTVYQVSVYDRCINSDGERNTNDGWYREECESLYYSSLETGEKIGIAIAIVLMLPIIFGWKRSENRKPSKPEEDLITEIDNQHLQEYEKEQEEK